MKRACKILSLFFNWFNGVCAIVCGAWMMASAVAPLPVSWNDIMPLSVYDNMPFHDIFFTSHFWPGLALLIVNGLSNVFALLSKMSGEDAWITGCIGAGLLLITWCLFELVYLPNPISVLYLVIGVVQLGAALALRLSLLREKARELKNRR